VILIWLAMLKVQMAEWPNLSRYFTDMKQRKSVKQALEEENLVNLYSDCRIFIHLAAGRT